MDIPRHLFAAWTKRSGIQSLAEAPPYERVQKDSPGKDKESNWLPAPDGPIYLVMRLYRPKTDPPSILPAGEGTWQPPALVKVR